MDTNSAFNYNGASDYALFALTPGDAYHVAMTFTASNQMMIATITNAQHTAGVRIAQLVNTNFTDFRLDAMSISSYSEAGQDPKYAGSVLAHGTIDNLLVTVPLPPIQDIAGALTNKLWQARFSGQTAWLYLLQRTADFKTWTDVSPPVAGTNGPMVLEDSAVGVPNAFYRVRAIRP